MIFVITGMMRKYKALLFRATREFGYFIKPPVQQSSFKLQGGYVGEPLRGFHKDVVVVDFKGMYPSIMMGENICTSFFKQSLWNIPPEMHGDFQKVIIPIERGLYELPGDYCVPNDFDVDQFLIQDGKAYNKEYVIEVINEQRYDIKMLESYVNLICETFKIAKFHKGTEEQLIMYLISNQKRRGVVPRVLERLKNERNANKKMMKKYEKLLEETKDPMYKILYNIYDQRQNAIKILMNSIYGIYGTQEGNFGFMEGSAAVTHFGRYYIGKVNEYLIANNCTIVYGDTDSSFFKFNVPPHYEQAELPDELKSMPNAEQLLFDLNERNRKTALINEVNRTREGN